MSISISILYPFDLNHWTYSKNKCESFTFQGHSLTTFIEHLNMLFEHTGVFVMRVSRQLRDLYLWTIEPLNELNALKCYRLKLRHVYIYTIERLSNHMRAFGDRFMTSSIEPLDILNILYPCPYLNLRRIL